jgi:cysteine-rich repeat protein
MGEVCFNFYPNPYSGMEIPWQLGYPNNGFLLDQTPFTWGPMVWTSSNTFTQAGSAAYTGYGAGVVVNVNVDVVVTSQQYCGRTGCHSFPVDTLTGGTGEVSTTAPPPPPLPTPGPPVCGNGITEAGEQCDDGAANGVPGDCCTAMCQFESAGTTCRDDGDLCTIDVCDAAGTCTHPIAPSPVCSVPTVAAGASLFLRVSAGGRTQARFLWSKGPAVPLASFGDPGGEALRLCVYDQTGPSTYTLALAGSPSMSGGGAWTGNAMGWKFKSTTGVPDGVTSVTLMAGSIPLTAKVQAKAIDSPWFGPLPLQQDPSVVAQLKTSLGACWGATFSTPTVNMATEFKAKSD